MTLTLLIWLFTISQPTPPGTIRIGDFLVDRSEVSIIAWKEYVQHRSQQLDSNDIKKIMPDRWFSPWYYGLYPATPDFPVVGITHQQALDYCKWRSEVVSRSLGKKITYRLPTIAEWQKIARIASVKQERNIMQEKNAMRNKIAGTSIASGLAEGMVKGDLISRLFTNVSEMTSLPGMAMGSSNENIRSLEEDLTTPVAYNQMGFYIGFRCIAEWD